MTNAIENWREATERVADAFVEKYFPDNPRYEDDGTPNLDIYWVGDDIGGVFDISDMFFGVDRMIEALDLNATFDQLYDYYHEAMEHGRDDPGKKEVREFVAMMEKTYERSGHGVFDASEYHALKAWLAKPSSDKPMVNFKDYVKYGWRENDRKNNKNINPQG